MRGGECGVVVEACQQHCRGTATVFESSDTYAGCESGVAEGQPVWSMRIEAEGS